MKKRNWLISTILMFGVVLGATNIAHACDSSKSHHSGNYHGHKSMHMIDKLDLSKEQRQAIRTIKNEQHNQMGFQKDELVDIKKALKEQAKSANYDAVKVEELANAKAKIMAAMTIQHLETKNRIRQQLTAEQIKKLDSFTSKKTHH